MYVYVYHCAHTDISDAWSQQYIHIYRNILYTAQEVLQVFAVYLVHGVVSHGAVVVWLRAVVTAVYSHAVSGHVLWSTGRRRRHHRRRRALACTAHAVRRRSCKSCCRNHRGAYKVGRCVFSSSSANNDHLFLSVSLCVSSTYALRFSFSL